MRIAEIFRSLQGEGRLTGADSIFVRASGCNLRCRFCDTPYASWSPEGDDLSVGEILERVDRIRRSPPPEFFNFLELADRPDEEVRNVVLTGGEPMLFGELVSLSAALRSEGFHITVETAGTIYLPVACDLMSISPKLSNSTPSEDRHPHWSMRHTAERHTPDIIRRLTAEYDYQVKFVVDRPEDCEEIESYLGEFPQIDRARVMLMPQGEQAAGLSSRTAWLEPYCIRRRLNFCPRRQIEWFGANRGT